MPPCCGEPIPACDSMFDARTADRDLDDLRRNGPPWATRSLIDQLTAAGAIDGARVVEIGAGIGTLHLALLERGAASAVDIDGSSAYLDVARAEAGRRGLADRVEHVLGDATAVAPGLEPADVVVLDRVVCCYPDLDALLAAATRLAVRRVGIVYPRDVAWIRVSTALANPLLFRGKRGYRMWIHRRARIESALSTAGFRLHGGRSGWVWRVECWERAWADGAGER